MSIKKSTKNKESLQKSAKNTTSQPTVFITIQPDVIQNKAYEISQKGLSWDELNWMIGEYELKLSKALEDQPNLLLGPLPLQISINPTKFIQKPKIEDVRKMATEYSNRGIPIPQLHWDLAIREYIYQSGCEKN